jgi:hypothetical protein
LSMAFCLFCKCWASFFNFSSSFSFILLILFYKLFFFSKGRKKLSCETLIQNLLKIVNHTNSVLTGIDTTLNIPKEQRQFKPEISVRFYNKKKYIWDEYLCTIFEHNLNKYKLQKHLPVACSWSVVLSKYSGFCHHENWTPWYSWNIAESGAKTPKIKKKNWIEHGIMCSIF